MKNCPDPIYVAPGRVRPSVGRLLLLSYDFPPGQSAGALRWQKLAAHAAERRWQLDAVTVHPATLRRSDESRLRDLPPGTRVYGVPLERLRIDRIEQAAWNFYQRIRSRTGRPDSLSSPVRQDLLNRPRPQSFGRDEASSLRWEPRDLVRAYYAGLLHLREGRWVRAAVALSESILRPGIHRAVITCGPPHRVHSGGRALAQRTGLPFVMDMRDPWSLVERLPEVIASPLWLRLVQRHERFAIAAASLIVCNTEPARDALQARYPEAAERCVAIMNGYDDEPIPDAHDNGRFLIAYAGTIYLDRDPTGLFRGAARLIAEADLSPDEFGIEFMGTVQSYNGLTVEEIARRAGIEGYVRVRPPAPRSEALSFLAGASVLVNLPQDSDTAIPSKVFEYMRFDAWLLALARRGSATEMVLRGSGADVVEPNDVAKIAAILRQRYDEYVRHGRPRQPALVERCSRAVQAGHLFRALDGVIKATDPMHAGIARQAS